LHDKAAMKKALKQYWWVELLCFVCAMSVVNARARARHAVKAA